PQGVNSQDRNAGHARGELFEQFKPFHAEAEFAARETGNIPARLCQSCDKAGANRIGSGSEDDWHVLARLLKRLYGDIPTSQHCVRRERNQFGRIFAHAHGVAQWPTILDSYIAAVGPTQLLQALDECGQPGKTFGIIRCEPAQENADPPHALRLGARRDRPRHRRAAEQRDELAPPDHSMTSSARASNVCEMVRPSALAVLRLITSSNLVGCCTGRSEGLKPLRIL